MNLFKNGTAMVVVGTIIVAALILITGRDDTRTDAGQISDVRTEEATSVVSNSDTDKVVDVVPELLASNKSVENKGQSLKAESIALETVASSSADSIKAVTKNVIEKENSVEAEEPKIDTAKSSQIAPPAGLYNVLEKGSTEIATITVPDAETTETDSKTESVDEASESESQAVPIWLDQKLGDFKSIDSNGPEGQAKFNITPNNSSDLQGSTPEQVVTNKEGKFVPSAIPENYNYQQMPMYNGGYYIAPMPSYLMLSVLPSSNVE